MHQVCGQDLVPSLDPPKSQNLVAEHIQLIVREALDHWMCRNLCIAKPVCRRQRGCTPMALLRH